MLYVVCHVSCCMLHATRDGADSYEMLCDFDLTHSGQLSRSELERGLGSLRITLSSTDFDTLFRVRPAAAVADRLHSLPLGSRLA